jgi:hypothetical protein
VQAPAADLAAFLRRGDEQFPSRRRYLLPDPAMRRNWKRRLNRRLGKGTKVGVSWRGGRLPGEQQRRSIPLDALAELHAVGAHFVCVQYDPRPKELEQLAAGGLEVEHWPALDALTDLEGLAALLCSLDVLITVDNSAAHLAAALGVPTWIMLPAACDWRWRHEGESTLWYPTARLFRQAAAGDWTGVTGRVRDALEALVGEDGGHAAPG